MEELLTNPFHYWGAIIGLFMASVILVSTGFFMIATSFKVMNVIRMKNYKKGVVDLLEDVYYKNHKANPEVAKVASSLLMQLAPERAIVLTSVTDVAAEKPDEPQV